MVESPRLKSSLRITASIGRRRLLMERLFWLVHIHPKV
jgi:hypothetical protein